MSSYEGSSLTEIEAVLDGLEEATAAEVYDATRGYSPKALAAVAASRADAASGGGGGTAPVHCVIARDAPTDVRTVGDHPILWDALYDNYSDFNTLLAIPDGLGLEFEFDGSSGSITTTEAGVWSFTYQTRTEDDPTWHAALNTGVGQATLDLGRDSTSMSTIITNVLRLPAGITLDHRVSTTTEATNNPYTLGFFNLLVTRIDAAGGGGGGADFPGEWTVDPDTGSLTITLSDDVVALTLLQGAGATVPALLVKDGDGDTYMFAQPDAIRLGGSDALPGEVQVDSSGVKVWGDTSNDSNPVIKSATGEKIGFFGATPAVRPSGVAVDAAAIHAALVTLGLIEA